MCIGRCSGDSDLEGPLVRDECGPARFNPPSIALVWNDSVSLTVVAVILLLFRSFLNIYCVRCIPRPSLASSEIMLLES